MFAKIFDQVFDSSIADNYRVRQFFIDLLILANQDGILDMTHEAISARTRIPLALVKRHIVELQKPDPRSRSTDDEGRRIVPIDEHRGWGWIIVNYKKYRAIKNGFDRRAYMANYMRNRRLVKPESNKVLRGLTPPSASASVQKEGGTGETRFKAPTIEEVKLFCAKSGISEPDAVWFFHKEEGNGWTNGGKPIKRWTSTIIAWKTAGYLPSQKLAQSGQPHQPGRQPYRTMVDDALRTINNFKPTP